MADLSIKIKDLQTEHPEYVALSPQWRTISILKDGVSAIQRNIERFLPRRPDEAKELYDLRVAKLSYTPVLSDAVNKYSAKLAGSPVQLTGNNDPFWETFRANTSNPKYGVKKESNLLQDIFGSLLYYGRVWAAVNRPDLGVNPRSAYESQGLPNSPYVALYEPLEVIYWSDEWAISRHIYPLVEPFRSPKTICRWTYWGLNENIIFEAEVKLRASKDSDGNVYDKVSQVFLVGQWLPWDSDQAIISPKSVWQHNIGQRVISTLNISSEKWVCSQVYNKQIQHLRIESAWTDAGYLSGVVQRLYTPSPPPPSDDPRITYEQPDHSKELALAGNQHILIGAGYAFVESTGAALGNLQGQLDKIEAQIRQLVSLHFASGDTSALSQSGLSKAMDMSLLEDSMKSYGQQVLAMYNNILRVVAKMIGVPEATAIGLSNYSASVMADLIRQLSIIETLPYIPPTAKKIAYGKLSQLMVGAASPEDEERIKQELEELFKDGGKKCSCDDEPDEDDDDSDADEILQGVVDDYGLSTEDYDYLYGDGDGGDSDLDLDDLGLSDKDMEYILNG